ncbi:unnamed protein product [Diamesa serratosioi]
MRKSLIFIIFAANILAFVLLALWFKTDNAIVHDISEEWEAFQIRFNKSYTTDEDKAKRMKIFSVNYDRIVKHNLQYDVGKVSYKMGINVYTDMVATEIRIGIKPEPKPRDLSVMNNFSVSYEFDDMMSTNIPDSIDWRTLGAVTSVKNQLPCGSCYAFAAIGALEGHLFIETGKLVSLSVQEIIDCSNSYANIGCEGGTMVSVFQYVFDNGIASEEIYPYDAMENSCQLNDDTEKIFTPYVTTLFLSSINEEQLKNIVATKGPISVGIEANEDFQHYESGVFYDPKWDKSRMNHGVLIVGYGTDVLTNKDYWIVKNSFGTEWGEEGYIKMSRNLDNNCGITLHAFIPSKIENKENS